MYPEEFKSRHSQTLQTDLKGGQALRNHIKLPISDLNELAYIQESLLECIMLLTQLEKRHYKANSCKVPSIG